MRVWIPPFINIEDLDFWKAREAGYSFVIVDRLLASALIVIGDWKVDNALPVYRNLLFPGCEVVLSPMGDSSTFWFPWTTASELFLRLESLFGELSKESEFDEESFRIANEKRMREIAEAWSSY